MNVLIVGSTGCIGEYLKNELNELNELNLFTPHSKELNIISYDDIVKYLIVHDIDAIVNCSMAKTNSKEFDIFNVNTNGSINLAKAADKSGVERFIQMSSIFSVQSEKNAYFSSYGLSKLLGDKYIEAINQDSKCKYSILRCPQIISASNFKNQLFLEGIIKSIISNNPITIFGNTNPERNLISVKTISLVIRQLLREETVQEENCIFNITNPSTRTLTELIRWFASELDYDIPNITHDKSKRNIPSYVIPVSDLRFVDILRNSDKHLSAELSNYKRLTNEKN